MDSDEDGVGDNADAFPEDPNEASDTDGDGLGEVQEESRVQIRTMLTLMAMELKMEKRLPTVQTRPTRILTTMV